jgi:hypothetical protein
LDPYVGPPTGGPTALVIFPSGTSGARLLAPAQSLIRDFDAHQQSYVAEGMLGVASYVCSPRAVQVIYRADLTRAQRSVLKSRLLAQAGAVTVVFSQ